MEVVRSVAAWRALRANWGTGVEIGFVPTMGYLHAGHLSLVQMARAAHARVVVSIFVNPLQFGPSEDLAAYPRDEARDLTLLELSGVDAVFLPSPAEMYPPDFATGVTLSGPLVERLEGARRPGHFAGVATVVTKLFGIVGPSHAYFGQKDAQQLAVVRRFVADLALPVEIVAGPIIREPDGLALSSRNVYLTPPQRAAATVLRRALAAGRFASDTGMHDAKSMLAAMRAVIAAEPLATLDYVDVVDPATFVPRDHGGPGSLLVLVAQVGKPRLLDNYLWRADGTWDTGSVAEEGHA
ncbi:MAG: pantoate--beta-alanine ligase [Ktedonobacterales bacterium]|nr:pantoate--beta-alanine ligase [Ktedonobacterales bacterium]